MTFSKGSKMPQREVPCIRCGCKLLRATYFYKATCGPCRTKHYRRNYSAQVRKFRQQARRYRIVLNILGWEDTAEGFADMLEEMKKSPMAFRKKIEGRLAKQDMTFERRVSVLTPTAADMRETSG